MVQRTRFRTTFNRGRPSTAHQPAHPQPGVAVPATPLVSAEQPHSNHQRTDYNATQQAHHSAKPKKVGFFFGRKWLLLVFIILAAGLVVLGYGYIHTKNQLNAAKNPTLAGITEAERITNHIKNAIELPTGETPTLATVNDVSKLKGQAFFKNAQNGDKVLVYTKAGVAVLYRPTTKKVIIYSFVNTNNNQQ